MPTPVQKGWVTLAFLVVTILAAIIVATMAAQIAIGTRETE